MNMLNELYIMVVNYHTPEGADNYVAVMSETSRWNNPLDDVLTFDSLEEARNYGDNKLPKKVAPETIVTYEIYCFIERHQLATFDGAKVEPSITDVSARNQIFYERTSHVLDYLNSIESIIPKEIQERHQEALSDIKHIYHQAKGDRNGR